MEASRDGTDDSYREHAGVHRIGAIAISAEDADAEGQPDEHECRPERETQSGSIGVLFIDHRFLPMG